MVDCACYYPPNRSKLDIVTLRIALFLVTSSIQCQTLIPQNQGQRGKDSLLRISTTISRCAPYHIFCVMHTHVMDVIGEPSVNRFVGYTIHVLKVAKANARMDLSLTRAMRHIRQPTRHVATIIACRSKKESG